jgi:hypothetical protein
MDKYSQMPGQAYDYIYNNYGTPGLIVAGVAIVLAVVGVFIWLDRRK